jgi:hypothetical protein
MGILRLTSNIRHVKKKIATSQTLFDENRLKNKKVTRISVFLTEVWSFKTQFNHPDPDPDS